MRLRWREFYILEETKMSKNDLMIFERNDMAVVSSRVIADRFNKRHNNLLSSIAVIIKGLLENKQTPAEQIMRFAYLPALKRPD